MAAACLDALSHATIENSSTVLENRRRNGGQVLSDLSWYAVQVSARQELVIASQLRLKGYEEFVPAGRGRRTWGSRVKQVSLPLFPGYVFCRLNLEERLLPLFTTPGVVRILGAGRVPIPIDDSEIHSLKTAVESGADLQPYPSIALGARVFITEGPLSGCVGVVVNLKKTWRLIVSITLLQRSVAVEIEGSWAEVIRGDEAFSGGADRGVAFGH